MEKRPTSYTFIGHGDIQPAWMRECLNLFKRYQVNIRKLVLLKDTCSRDFSRLELQFALPTEIENESNPFMICLEEQLASQEWHDKSLDLS